MSTDRLEAFSDGVIAIIITIMVLELHVPEGDSLNDLIELLPKFLAYLLSFAIIGTYWNNHHHLLKAAEKVNASIMWANLFLLFWLSLIPFFTGWLGEHYMQSWPVAMYGIILLLCAFSYQLLQQAIVSRNGKLAANLGGDLKGKLSLASYISSVILAFIFPAASLVLFAFVDILWFVPDNRLIKAK